MIDHFRGLSELVRVSTHLHRQGGLRSIRFILTDIGLWPMDPRREWSEVEGDPWWCPPAGSVDAEVVERVHRDWRKQIEVGAEEGRDKTEVAAGRLRIHPATKTLWAQCADGAWVWLKEAQMDNKDPMPAYGVLGASFQVKGHKAPVWLA